MTADSASARAPRTGGDADISTVAALFADPTRARVLLALADGRSLPAGVLASEAGVSPQAASAQLKRLTRGGLITGETSGRHRYYRLVSDQVASILEALAGAAPSQPIRSLREGTRAAALRRARTCYDHLAGRLGCDLTQALLDAKALRATDGLDTTRRRTGDLISSPLPEHPYQLGPNSQMVLEQLGVRTTFSRGHRRAGVHCCGSAWIGASNATTSAASSAPPSSPRSKTLAGSPAAPATAPSPSPTSASSS